MDEKMNADILAVCNTLGYSDGSRYFRDPQCLDSAKGLVLYLKKDSEQHDVRRLLGEAQILQKDLIPIFKMKDCDDELADVVLRLILNFTQPSLILYEHGLPKNKTYRNHFMIITQHLQAYKIAFVDESFWVVIFTKLKKLLGDVDLLLHNQKATIEKILTLIRYVLQVPADPAEEMRNDDDASVHDQMLWVLHSSGVLDLLLFISSSDTTREFCMDAIAIITLIFREHSGEQLAKTNVERSEAEKMKDVSELTQTLHAESLVKSRKHMLERSFGGTFVIQGLLAPSGREQICHKPVQSVSDLSLDNMKKVRKTPVNRRQIVEPNNTRRSTLAVRLFLKEFCVEFLIRAYNNLMRIVKDQLARSRGGPEENDEIYYLQTLRFFMEFNRFYKFRIRLVSETMESSTTFHYVQGLVDRYHELMVTDKENMSVWSKRAHTALRAYQLIGLCLISAPVPILPSRGIMSLKRHDIEILDAVKAILFNVAVQNKELLSSLHAMERTPANRESARAIYATIFYMAEYRELCVNLLASYDTGKLSRNYLCDLVDTNHLFLKMLEDFTREKRILVAGRIKRRRSTKKKNSSRKKNKRTRRNSEGSWARLEEKLTELLSSDFEPEQAMPFDAASDTPIDEQKSSTLNRIATHISQEQFIAAMSLFRAAKEVWSDDNQLSMETEISSLKSIFLQATLFPDDDDDEDEMQNGHGHGYSSDEERDNNDEEEEYGDDGHDEREIAAVKYASESEFEFRGFLEKYAVVKIVANLGNLFKQFETLPPLTLHAILKMFHRYSFEMGYPAMICQASIFHSFQAILKMATYRVDLKEAAKFCQHFWAKFVKLAEENPKIFLEILFWKSSREAQEIQEGYTQYDHTKAGAIGRKAKSTRKALSVEEENEIIVLANEYNALSEKTMKQAEWINDKLINGPKFKKTIITFLTERQLLFQGRVKRQPKGSRRKNSFLNSERVRLSSGDASSSNEGRSRNNSGVSRNSVSSRSDGINGMVRNALLSDSDNSGDEEMQMNGSLPAVAVENANKTSAPNIGKGKDTVRNHVFLDSDSSTDERESNKGSGPALDSDDESNKDVEAVENLVGKVLTQQIKKGIVRNRFSSESDNSENETKSTKSVPSESGNKSDDGKSIVDRSKTSNKSDDPAKSPRSPSEVGEDHNEELTPQRVKGKARIIYSDSESE